MKPNWLVWFHERSFVLFSQKMSNMLRWNLAIIPEKTHCYTITSDKKCTSSYKYSIPFICFCVDKYIEFFLTQNYLMAEEKRTGFSDK